MACKILKFIYEQGDKEVVECMARAKESKQGSLPIHMLVMNVRNHDASVVLKGFKVFDKYWNLVRRVAGPHDIYLHRNNYLDYPLELVIKKGYTQM